MKRLLVVVLFSLVVYAQEPQFTKDNQLVRPNNFREWIFLSSGLGMTYGPARASAGDHPRFENVFVNPRAYKSFVETGSWPDKTILILEIRASATKGSINQGGFYQDEVDHIQALVKDESRFPDKWAFFAFGDAGGPAREIPKSAGCHACHSKNAAVEWTFVQFYPTLLPIAKAKGTLKSQ
jgi:hypothetical protein